MFPAEQSNVIPPSAMGDLKLRKVNRQIKNRQKIFAPLRCQRKDLLKDFEGMCKLLIYFHLNCMKIFPFINKAEWGRELIFTLGKFKRFQRKISYVNQGNIEVSRDNYTHRVYNIGYKTPAAFFVPVDLSNTPTRTISSW